VTGLKYTEPENEVLCIDMQLCVVIIIELCVLDNTLQKLVGPIFVCFDNSFFLTASKCSRGPSFPWAKLSQHRRDISIISCIFSSKKY